MRLRAIPMAILAGFLLAGGCARYEYVLLEPGGEQVVAPRERLAVTYEPMIYRLARTDRDRLLVRITNTTDQPIRVIGERSYVVDPEGQTHPLGRGTIAPHAYIDLVLPPPPRVYRGYPRYHYGMGYGRWYRHHHPYGWGYFPYGRGFYYDPWMHDPSMYTVEVYGPYHWEWATGTIRLHLAYERGEERFDHNLAILRRRSN
jgi:hypothetical protein